ncbi:hypothetical protein [Urinicoccus timonensis]|uniref:hypothetical protein n=1 Tax=Urinicoccus timonensis TaxID=2024205 RepID=UPI001F3DA22D|nr:hypothetical protein [Urinicoccus timonensis]
MYEDKFKKGFYPQHQRSFGPACPVFLQYKMNKPHLGDILWMVFLAEGAYWATVFWACLPTKN